MKKLLMIDTTWPINSRTERFRVSLSKKYLVHVSAWNRGASKNDSVQCHDILDSNIKYGNRFGKLFLLPKFIRHNVRVVENNSPEIIFASHWDSLICAVIAKKITGSTAKIVYDCLDLPSSSNRLLLKLLKMVEGFSLSYTDFVIFASRYYPDLYNLNQSYLVYENYPSRYSAPALDSSPSWYDLAKELKIESSASISWIGVVRYPEVLCNLILSIKALDVKLFVFGDGPSLDYLKSYVISEGLEGRVNFFGRYKYNELPFIYEVTDFVWAAYPTLDFNSVYAISNKYFESSLFCRVPIFSNNTKMAESLRGRNPSVLLVDEYDVDSISVTLSSAIGEDIINLPFCKYEEDVFWDDVEDKLFDALSGI